MHICQRCSQQMSSFRRRVGQCEEQAVGDMETWKHKGTKGAIGSLGSELFLVHHYFVSLNLIEVMLHSVMIQITPIHFTAGLWLSLMNFQTSLCLWLPSEYWFTLIRGSLLIVVCQQNVDRYQHISKRWHTWGLYCSGLVMNGDCSRFHLCVLSNFECKRCR